MNTVLSRAGLSDSCTRPSRRSVANHLTCSMIAFARYPSASWTPVVAHGLDFASG